MPPGIGGGDLAGGPARRSHGAKCVCNWMFEKGKDKYGNHMEIIWINTNQNE